MRVRRGLPGAGCAAGFGLWCERGFLCDRSRCCEDEEVSLLGDAVALRLGARSFAPANERSAAGVSRERGGACVTDVAAAAGAARALFASMSLCCATIMRSRGSALDTDDS